MRLKLTVVMSSLTMALAACGGGGSDNGESVVTPPAAQPVTQPVTQPIAQPIVTQPSDLQSTVPIPTYDANTANLASFNAINEFRASLGLGLWAQNVKLDMAAKNHVDYLVTNHEYGHAETFGLPGFTGVNATERAAYVGYVGNWVGEVGTAMIGSVRTLINTVYHRSALMNQQMSEVGIANSTNPNYRVQFISFSNVLKNQKNAPDYFAVYPLNEQINVPLLMMGESVNPYPSIALPSSPISFISAYGTKLKVISFTVTAQGSSTPLVTQLITQDNDPNLIYLPPHEAYIAGVEPFLPNTVYNVSFIGQVNNLDVNKNWSFMTGMS